MCCNHRRTLCDFDKIPHMPFPGGRLFKTPALVLAMSYYRVRDIL
ncbi:hypothetical protein JCM19240_5566 [Vibrio maritimus]|uniref:Uncharacterized protein n=1 Tax=Vibrio maritimus TaxID=990268 RepID=A0A090SWJ2_9VIBR|nr:hypothetical protein JCM19240_5566 [Vibrio maritimus]